MILRTHTCVYIEVNVNEICIKNIYFLKKKLYTYIL